MNDQAKIQGTLRLLLTDAFGFAAAKPLCTAHLRMGLRAANLLREEYPLSKKYIVEKGDGYETKLPFCNFKGIGGFIRGLREEIEVPGPVGLKKIFGGVTEVDSGV